MDVVSYIIVLIIGSLVGIGLLLPIQKLNPEQKENQISLKNLIKNRLHSKSGIITIVVTAVLYLWIFFEYRWSVYTILLFLLTAALITLSMIDFDCYEIPFVINCFIVCLGIIQIAVDFQNWEQYVIGFFAISSFLLILFYATGGRGIGGGDVKLMAAAGLFVGWKLIILAFFVGCILGSVIHLIRMKVTKEDHVLAMGPYLSMGIFLAVLYGNTLIQWYFERLLG